MGRRLFSWVAQVAFGLVTLPEFFLAGCEGAAGRGDHQDHAPGLPGFRFVGRKGVDLSHAGLHLEEDPWVDLSTG